MCNIDQIMDMLDWNNPPEIQEKGRALARDVRCINVFIQPGHPGHVKNVWDNCALILAERSDVELRPYIPNLLQWLIDINWPGAYCIEDRLVAFEDDKWLNCFLEDYIHVAKVLNEEMWLTSLLELQKLRKNKNNG